MDQVFNLIFNQWYSWPSKLIPFPGESPIETEPLKWIHVSEWTMLTENNDWKNKNE